VIDIPEKVRKKMAGKITLAILMNLAISTARFLRWNSLRIDHATQLLNPLNLTTILRICGDLT
jgi:hypothetical protein